MKTTGIKVLQAKRPAPLITGDPLKLQIQAFNLTCAPAKLMSP